MDATISDIGDKLKQKLKDRTAKSEFSFLNVSLSTKKTVNVNDISSREPKHSFVDENYLKRHEKSEVSEFESKSE